MVETTTEKDEFVSRDIILSAQKLFQQFGVKKTTMNDIAAASGKAKSTLYYYFKSKDDVYDAVFHLEIRNLRSYVKAKVDEQNLTSDKIRIYILEFYKEVRNKMNLYRLVNFRDLPETHTRNYFLELMGYEKLYIEPILENGIKAGECKNFVKEDVSCFAEIFLAATLGNIQFLIEKEGSYNEEKIIKIVDVLIPSIFG
jgi:AcrR family transcriptional regulator